MLPKSVVRKRCPKAVLGGLLTSTALLLSGAVVAQGSKTGIDPETWTAEHVMSIAGTEDANTAEECSQITPLDYEGEVTYWFYGTTEASPQIDRDMEKAFFDAFRGDLSEYRARRAEYRLQRPS